MPEQFPLSAEEMALAIGAFSRDPGELDSAAECALGNGGILIDEHKTAREFVYTDEVVRECLRIVAVLDSGDVDWAEHYLVLLIRILCYNGVAKHYHQALLTARDRSVKRQALSETKQFLLEAKGASSSLLGAPSSAQRERFARRALQAGQDAGCVGENDLAKWFYLCAVEAAGGIHAALEGGAHQSLGVVAARTGRVAEARDSLKKASVLLSAYGDEENLAGTWIELGLLEMDAGEFDAAQSYMLRALDVFEHPGRDNAPLSRSAAEKRTIGLPEG
jgi:tetratricopeptide (TPR) repeat protein